MEFDFDFALALVLAVAVIAAYAQRTLTMVKLQCYTVREGVKKFFSPLKFLLPVQILLFGSLVYYSEIVTFAKEIFSPTTVEWFRTVSTLLLGAQPFFLFIETINIFTVMLVGSMVAISVVCSLYVLLALELKNEEIIHKKHLLTERFLFYRSYFSERIFLRLAHLRN